MKSLLAIVPSAGVLFLFWLAIRGILQADRRERQFEERRRTVPSEISPQAPGRPGATNS